MSSHYKTMQTDAWMRHNLPRWLYVLSLIARHPVLVATGLYVLITGKDSTIK